MNPTKNNNMLDFMHEMNRLFPRTGENDFLSSSPTTSQSFNRSIQSSSSNDTSPDSFDLTRDPLASGPMQNWDRPDHSVARPVDCQKMDLLSSPMETDIQFNTMQLYGTPSHRSSRERPIVGRKIFTSENMMSNDFQNICSEEEHTPPNKKSMYYELFPTENELTMPNNYSSPNMCNTSPGMTSMPSKIQQTSPQFYMFEQEISSLRQYTPYETDICPIRQPSISETPSIQRTSPLSRTSSISQTSPLSKMSWTSNYMPTSPYPQKSPTQLFKEPIRPTTSYDQYSLNKMCSFCKKNGETALVYMTHKVKEKIGNRNVVACPILRSHVCSTCGASGDDAHTISYCPVLRSINNGFPLPSTTVTLKNTRVKSNGRRRY